MEIIEAIRDVVLYCLCPLLVILDFSYGALKFGKVFILCEKWWESLSSLQIRRIVSLLPERITQIFVAMYGKKHFSLICIYRSIISSILAMSLVFFFLNLIDISGIGTKNVFRHIEDALVKLGARLNLSPILIFAVILLLNFIVDYFSLLETRWILSRIKKARVFRTITLSITDYICTTLIWVISFYSLVIITNSFADKEVIPFVKMNSVIDALFFPFVFSIEYMKMGGIGSGHGIPIGHLIGLLALSTYFTSLLFYVFAFLSIVFRSAESLRVRTANVLLKYSKKRIPRPLSLLAIILGVISQGTAAIAKLIEKVF